MQKTAALALIALLAVAFVAQATADLNCHTSCYGGKLSNKAAVDAKKKLFAAWSATTKKAQPQILTTAAVKGNCDASLFKYKFKNQADKDGYQKWEKSPAAAALYAPLKANSGAKLPANSAKEYSC